MSASTHSLPYTDKITVETVSHSSGGLVKKRTYPLTTYEQMYENQYMSVIEKKRSCKMISTLTTRPAIKTCA